MADWKKTASTSTSAYAIGNGLLVTAGVLAANPGVGLAIDGGGFLVVNPGQGLGIAGSQVIVPAGAITNALLAALSVGTAQLQNSSVTGTQIAAASITTAHIGAAQITTALIANAAITNVLLGTAVVGTANIQNAAITTALCGSLSASVIATGTLSVDSVISSGFVTTTVNGVGIIIANSSTTYTSTLGPGEVVISETSSGAQAYLQAGGGSGSFAASYGLSGIAIAGTVTSTGAFFSITSTSGVPDFMVNYTSGTVNGIPSNTIHISSAAAAFNCLAALTTLAALKVNGLIQFGGTNSTGSGAALLGSNCPAGGSLTAPNTWIEVVNAVGTAGWVPMWV